MNELPTYHGPCPYCGSAISVVIKDGTTVARCSHRGCGARGPVMRSLDRAVELFRRGRATHPEPPDAGRCDVPLETYHGVACELPRGHDGAHVGAEYEWHYGVRPPDAGRHEPLCPNDGLIFASKCPACNGTGRKVER